jgi:hypothetical protein
MVVPSAKLASREMISLAQQCSCGKRHEIAEAEAGPAQGFAKGDLEKSMGTSNRRRCDKACSLDPRARRSERRGVFDHSGTQCLGTQPRSDVGDTRGLCSQIREAAVLAGIGESVKQQMPIRAHISHFAGL